ncbi:Replication protein [Klebsiella oxytoca]|nr:Replication protein [Klebsiella oxytoca]
MFTRDYVKHDRWVELWRECLRVNYDPNVDVRAVKPRKPKDGESLASATAELVRGAVAETLKYSTKPADMVADPEWFLELTKQTHKRRFVATGGALKDILKLDQETDADMVIGMIFPKAMMMVHALLLSGKPNPKSTVAHRQKIKLNQTDRVSGRSPDHDVFERTPLVGGTPKTHLVLLVLLRCRIGLTPQSGRHSITEFGFRTQLGQDVFLVHRHHDVGAKNDSSGLRPDTLPTPHAVRIKICQRSLFPKSSNSKSWGPAGLPVGSDLVIDDIAD